MIDFRCLTFAYPQKHYRMNSSTLNNTLSKSSQTCPSTNTLLGGSAAFIQIALLLGVLAQPPGSLVVSPLLGYWRLWRLAPILCGLEGLTILLMLLHAFKINISQRERAFVILAKRTTATHDETRTLQEYLERPKLELIVPMMLQFCKNILHARKSYHDRVGVAVVARLGPGAILPLLGLVSPILGGPTQTQT